MAEIDLFLFGADADMDAVAEAIKAEPGPATRGDQYGEWLRRQRTRQPEDPEEGE